MTKIKISQVSNLDKAFAILDKQTRNVMDLNTPDLLAALQDGIMGQDHLLVPISRTLPAKFKMKQANEPRFSMLLAGPPSTGKTELARVLAEVLFGSRDALVEAKVQDFAPNEVAGKFFGQAGIYQNSGEGLVTKQARARKGKMVLLIDEFEKSYEGGNNELGNRLYGVLANGVYTDPFSDTEVDLRDAVIIGTANAQENEMRKIIVNSDGDWKKTESACREQLVNRPFPRALVTRFNFVSTTAPLSRDTLSDVFWLQIQKIVANVPLSVVLRNDDGEEGIDPFLLAQMLHWHEIDVVNNTARNFPQWFNEHAGNSLIEAREAGAKAIRLVWDETVNFGDPGIRAIPVEFEGGSPNVHHGAPSASRQATAPGIAAKATAPTQALCSTAAASEDEYI